MLARANPVACFRVPVLLAAVAAALPGSLPAQSPAPATPSVPAASAITALTRPARDLGASTEVGYGILQTKCLTCHGKPEYPRAPSPAALYQYTPERIYDSLTKGVMAGVVGNQLSESEKRVVAEIISGRRLGTADSADAGHMPNRCAANPPLQQAAQRPAWNGWGADVQNTRFQSAASAGLTVEDVPRLKLKWAFALPNSTSAYAQPSLVFGRVYVGADTGYVYSLDAATGCVYWSFDAGHAVRTAMSIGRVKVRGSSGYAVFFGDRQANVYAVDAQTGRKLWMAHPEPEFTARITAAPTYYDGRLYVPLSSYEEFSASTATWECCKSQGGVAALDAGNGRRLWLRHVPPRPPQPTHRNSQGVQQWGPAGGAVWNSPTIDPLRHAVYFGTGDATTYPAIDTSDAVMAVDMDTGRVLWSYQVFSNDSFLIGCGPGAGNENCPRTVGPDWDIPASPVLKTLRDGSRRLIVVTKPGDVLALDPDKRGALVWRVNATGPVVGNRLPKAGERAPPGFLWGVAVGEDAMYFGLTHGGAGAIDIATGRQLWLNPLESAQGAGYNSATSAFPGVALLGSSDGQLQALSTTDGKLLWSFDTRREFDAVNGIKARGGSINAQGPVVADGMVVVGSGFAVVGGTPGNLVAAFAVQ
ncbi:MAG TPA: PQQ-binding-like beta-propeller repeat protein [Steroidobacteraceae bacterium]|nr:PQQ-binding-like beta-propeller repeat protein [Steroidobacteraceae bacterium]